MRTSLKPALSSIAVVRSALAMLKGPGAGGGSSGGMWPRRPRLIPMSPKKGLRSGAPQLESASRPPGRRTRRVSASAAAESAMSMYANRHSTPSTESASRSMLSAFVTLYSTFVTPSSVPRRRAASTIAGERSVVISRPRSPMAAAAWKPVSPTPEASSSTVSPSLGRTSATIQSRMGVQTHSMSSLRRSHDGAIASAIS